MSRKGAKKRTHGRKLRSTGTKARARVARSDKSQAALIRKLKARARDLEKKLGEALEQQTASSEVLRVISSSPGELEPVFQTMLTNAVQHLRSQVRQSCRCVKAMRFCVVALHGAPPSYAEERRRDPVDPTPIPELCSDASLTTKRPVQVADIRVDRITHITPIEAIHRREICQASRCPNRARRSDAQGERVGRRDPYLSPGGTPLHRQADRVGSTISPRRPSSPSRTRGCSTSCASALTIYPNCWSSRQRPPRCCKSFPVRPARWSLCFRRCWRTPCASAGLISETLYLRDGDAFRYRRFA